jgi:hypothetical protein
MYSLKNIGDYVMLTLNFFVYIVVIFFFSLLYCILIEISNDRVWNPRARSINSMFYLSFSTFISSVVRVA